MDTNQSIETTIKDMWHTRPTRIPKSQGGSAMVAGVCEGIGARYQIDPVIVRLAFVGLTLAFGGGIFAYLLMWMNMPRYGMSTSPWRAINTPKAQLDPQERRDRNTGWWLLVGLVVFFPSLSAGAGGFVAASFITLALAAAALYLLHRSHPIPPAELSASAADTGIRVDTSHLSAPAGYPHPDVGQTTPPSWDPLGAAPELWHLPDLEEETVPPPQEKKRGGVWGWLIALGVAGLIALAAMAATVGGLHAGARVDVGSEHVTVTDDLRDTYESGIGDTTIDLSHLAPLDGDRQTRIQHDIGTVTIIPPKDTRVEFTCDEGLGSNNCPPTLNDASGGATLSLDIDLGIGEIEVAAP